MNYKAKLFDKYKQYYEKSEDCKNSEASIIRKFVLNEKINKLSEKIKELGELASEQEKKRLEEGYPVIVTAKYTPSKTSDSIEYPKVFGAATPRLKYHPEGYRMEKLKLKEEKAIRKKDEIINRKLINQLLSEVICIKKKIEKMGSTKIDKVKKVKACLKPEIDLYWFIDNNGKIKQELNRDKEIAYNRKIINNIFESEKLAIDYKKHLEIKLKLSYIAKRLNFSREINWEDRNQEKVYLEWRDGIDQYYELDRNYAEFGIIYCLNDSFRDIAIKEIGEKELISYLKYER